MHNRLQDLQKLLYNEIPLTRYLRLTVDRYDERGLRLCAPLQENVNHFGTAFAGSLSALATLSGWSLVWFMLQELDMKGVIVIQDNSCKYLLPVKEDFAAFCYRPDIAQVAKFAQTLGKRGRARIELKAEIYENDKLAMTFNGRYVVEALK